MQELDVVKTEMSRMKTEMIRMKKQIADHEEFKNKVAEWMAIILQYFGQQPHQQQQQLMQILPPELLPLFSAFPLALPQPQSADPVNSGSSEERKRRMIDESDVDAFGGRPVQPLLQRRQRRR